MKFSALLCLTLLVCAYSAMANSLCIPAGINVRSTPCGDKVVATTSITTKAKLLGQTNVGSCKFQKSQWKYVVLPNKTTGWIASEYARSCSKNTPSSDSNAKGTNPVPGYRVTTPFGKKGSWSAGYHTGDDYGLL